MADNKYISEVDKRNQFKSFVLGALLLLLNGTYVKAQENCGTFLDEKDIPFVDFVNSERDFQVSRNLYEIEIPVVIHFVNGNDYNMPRDSVLIVEQLNAINNNLHEVSMFVQPCQQLRNIILSNELPFIKGEERICEENDVLDVLNIYVVNELRTSQSQNRRICGYTYLSDTDRNRIIIDRNCLKNKSTLAHELGHFYSLLHTHENIFGRESVARIDCDEKGDLLCDTPADPSLTDENIDADCEFIGFELDPNGDLYFPDTDNLMSYSPQECRRIFTSGQKNRMRIYAEEHRNYLSCNYVSTHTIDLKEAYNLAYYPNPFNSSFTLRFHKLPESIVLLSINGEVVIDINPMPIQTVPTEHLPSGMYVLRIVDKKRVITKRIIKS